MNVNHYIGFDVHKKAVSYCVKVADGTIVEEGKLRATHEALRQWAGKRSEPWRGAMEATLFSGWIYDALKPFAAELQMGHPAMMKAIGASKKKNDKLDARKIGDLVRCNLLPACYVAPAETRELRRMMRYRNLVVEQATRMKIKMSGLLMECGRRVQQAATTREEILRGVAGQRGGGAGIGEGSAAAESGSVGDVRDDATAVTGPAAKRQTPGKEGGVTEEYSGRGRSDGAHLDPGSGRAATVFIGGACGELLRVDVGAGIFGRQTTARADLETAQCTFADGADRSRKVGAAVEPAIGSGAHTGIAAGEPQPCDTRRGAETGGISVSGGQIREGIRGSHSTQRRNGGAESGLRKCSELTSGKVVFPPKPPVVRPRMPERSSLSRVRWAAPRAGAPLTAAGRSAGRISATGGSGGKTTTEGVQPSDDLLAIHRPFPA